MSSNLRTRTITSIVYVLVMFAALMFNPAAFGGLFLLIMAVSLKEFFAMSLGFQCTAQQSVALLTAGLIYILHFCVFQYGMDSKWLIFSLIPLLAVPSSFLFGQNTKEFGLSAYLYQGFLYILLPVITALRLALDGADFNGRILLFIFIVIWLCDAGAYLIGSALGQRPGCRRLAPSISPKKSVIGFWGGIFCGTFASVVMGFAGFVPYGWAHCIALGAIISLFSVIGDLVESLWKRYFGIKDSGNCIPGHGGMLDRFDSSLFAIPAAAVYLFAFSLV